MSLGELGISQGNVLKCYEHIFVFLTMVGVLVLVYYLIVRPSGYGLTVGVTKPEGFQMNNYSAGNLGYYGQRTDSTGALELADPYGLSAAQAYGLRSSGEGFSNGAYEPPVYWPAGSLGMINAYGQSAMGLASSHDASINAALASTGAEGADMNASADGFRSRGNYAMGSLQGFRNRHVSGMQNALDKSMMG